MQERDKFVLKSKYQPTGDQPKAIKELVESIRAGHKEQTLLGVPVLGSQLALSYTDDCLTAVEGTFYTGGSSITRVSEQEAISAADALAQLLARRDALGWVGSAVTGLTQAYLPSDQAGTGIRFVPVWLVETDAGSFFINGITREITAEK